MHTQSPFLFNVYDICYAELLQRVLIRYSLSFVLVQIFVLYTFYLRKITTILNWMCEGSFVLAKYHIVMIFYKHHTIVKIFVPQL